MFLDNDPSDFSFVSNNSFYEIVEAIVTDNAKPTFWFNAVGGMVLITLVLNNVVTRLPQGNSIFYLS